MATRELTPEQLASVTARAEQWGRIVARNAYGDDGPGLDVDFDPMEQIAAAATAGLAAGTIEHLAEQRARRLPDQLPCPTCHRPCSVEHRPRDVVARGATVTLREPVAHGPACRRDVFPPADQPPAGFPRVQPIGPRPGRPRRGRPPVARVGGQDHPTPGRRVDQ